MIQVVNAKKFYNRGKKNQITAIDNTTLTFPDKGLVAMLGNSGCGKTTLLNMIGGLDRPDSGNIFVNGEKINGIFSGKTDNIRNKHIGYIFQNYHLVDDMTVFENVALPLRMLGVRSKEELKERAYYALEMVGLYRYRNRPASALSGGERQRVGIARAIVKNPGIIIADEPTGNLDSGNSLEIMNIIKTISAEKLVILVTHERNLAEFYADRVIEIVDGKVVGDRENQHNDKLDYRIDNKLYLKDFEHQENVTTEGVKMDVYSDGSVKPQIRMVIRNGNIYFECNGAKTEVVDENSVIEFVDEHYHALSLEEASKSKFDYSKLELNGKKKVRYHSIYNMFSLFVNGVRKVLNYPRLKKVLLIGFVASAMFVMYAISNYLGITSIDDTNFVSVNKNYLLLRRSGYSVEYYKEIEAMEGIGYIFPGESTKYFSIDYSNFYYQTKGATDNFTASLSAASLISEKDLTAGRLPENDKEVVLDEMIFTQFKYYGHGDMVGLKEPSDYIGVVCNIGGYKDLTVVGISKAKSPSAYVTEDQIFNLAMYANGSGGYYYEYDKVLSSEKSYFSGNQFQTENNDANIMPVSAAAGTIKVYSGRMPNALYEVIAPIDYMWSYKIGGTIQGKVNGQSLTIVGFYTSDNSNDYLPISTDETYEYQFIRATADITIYAKDKDAVLSALKEKNIDVVDTYESAKKEYEKEREEQIKTTTIIAIVVLAISLVEIFLMLRSSFLSRIKEVGTLRAIGLKKSDVYKMFLGEILVITALTAPIGFIIMGSILKTLCKIAVFQATYVFNAGVVIAAAVVIVACNVVFGLLPVFFTLWKTPARILSRTDVD